MLKTDFNGYAEFAEKLLKAESGQEKEKLYTERIQMWVGKLENILSPIPAIDEVFALVALHMITEALEKADPEAALMAGKFQKRLDYKMETGKINPNMTEAAARAYTEAIFKK